MTAKETLYCSFCRKSQHDVRKLIAGPACFICGECTGLCADICCADRVPDKSVRASMLWALFGPPMVRPMHPEDIGLTAEGKMP